VLKRAKAELPFCSEAEVFDRLEAAVPLGAEAKLQVGAQKGSQATMLQRSKTAVPVRPKAEL